MIQRRLGTMAALLSLAAAPLAAESFRNAPSRPLLVMTTYSTTSNPLSEPPDPRVSVNVLFVFADRTLIESFNYSPEPFGVHPQLSSHVRGRVPKAEWNALLSEMIKARVDIHEDCKLRPIGAGGGPLPFHDVVFERVIRWYGRQGRTNTFSIVDGFASAPYCELTTYNLTDALAKAVTVVRADKTSEYFSVP